VASRFCMAWAVPVVLVLCPPAHAFPDDAPLRQDAQGGGTYVPPPVTGTAAPVTEVPPEPGEFRYRLSPPFADPAFGAEVWPEPQKNYLIPLGEVVTINILIWGWNYIVGKEFAKISWDSIEQNFRKGWIVDTDDFWANGALHPYHGSLTFNAARSMGLNFYESFAYAFAGSLMWEQFMEIQPASLNDQVNTPFGGSVLGEVLFRMHRLVLDSGGVHPSGWTQFAALAIAPSAGLNHLFFGNTYRGPPLLPPSWMGEFNFGAVIAGWSNDDRTGASQSSVGPWASIGAHVLYGVPGTPHLELRRPFDHFDFSGAIAFTDGAQPSAQLLIRGLLIGDTIGPGGAAGGLWGLFTSYDFLAVSVFRATGWGLGPGFSLMKRWGEFELHGTALLELLPWSGGGSTVPLGVRDYHYGTGGEALLEFRMLFGDRVIAKLSGRQFLISGNYARGNWEDISYGQAFVTVRLVGPHSLSGGFEWSRRHANEPGTPDVSQSGGVVSAYYTLMAGW
jgi:hypothetical protein